MDRLPIEFHNAAGEVTNALYSRPVIRLRVELKGQPPMDRVAAIDTGAGRSFIRTSLVPPGTMPAELSVPVITADGRRSDTLSYTAILGSPLVQRRYQVNLVALEFNHTFFDMLLGIDFLLHGILVLNYRDHASSHFALHDTLNRSEGVVAER